MNIHARKTGLKLKHLNAICLLVYLSHTRFILAFEAHNKLESIRVVFMN